MDAGPPGPPPNGDAGQASPQSRQRNRLLLLAAGTALFAVGVGAGWLGLRPSAGDGSRTGLIRCVPAAVSAAGSSEHLILIEQWSFAYQRLCPGGTLSYSPVGSGAGIQQFIAGQASFVGSNRPLIPSEAAQARARCHGNAPLSLPLAVSSAGTLYVIVCQKGLPGDQARLVKSFLTYTTSPAGQALLTANGYTPLPATVLAGVRSSVRKLS